MTELLFLKFNLASPLATDANVRMSEPDESSRNYHVQVEMISKHASRPRSLGRGSHLCISGLLALADTSSWSQD